MTGTVEIASATGNGDVRSKNGLAAVIALDGPGTYYFQNVNADTVSKGTGSGTVTIPLPSAPEGSNTVRFQYRNARNFVSPIYEKTFFVDGVAPMKSVVVAPPANSSGSTVAFDWSDSEDSGSGLPSVPYFYELSGDSGFAIVTESGATSSTGVILNLAEGTNYFRVSVSDVAGNVTVSDPVSVFVDTLAPDAPTELSLN